MNACVQYKRKTLTTDTKQCYTHRPPKQYQWYLMNLVKHPQTRHLTQFVTHKYFHKYNSKNGKSDKGEAI